MKNKVNWHGYISSIPSAAENKSSLENLIQNINTGFKIIKGSCQEYTSASFPSGNKVGNFAWYSRPQKAVLQRLNLVGSPALESWKTASNLKKGMLSGPECTFEVVREL